MPINEKLKKALVDYYNEYRPLFDNVPPDCSIPIPKAKTKKERKQKEYWDVVTSSSVKRRFEGIRELSPAAIDTFTSKKYEEKERWTINLNPVYFSHPRDSKEEVFPLLHEMTHVKERVLSKNNLKLESKLPPVKRVALLYGQRPLNKRSTKVLMFPFAIPCKARGFQSKQ